MSMVKCDICEKSGANNEVHAVTDWVLCDECYYAFLSNTENTCSSAYNTEYNNEKCAANSCRECGVNIDSDRSYCDKCLGYGVCQECGISVDSDRLYCDRCLGYGVCQECGISIDSDRLYCDKCLGYGVCQECGKEIDSDRLYCNTCLYN